MTKLKIVIDAQHIDPIIDKTETYELTIRTNLLLRSRPHGLLYHVYPAGSVIVCEKSPL